MPDFPECHGFIACSLDGYIARLNGDVTWLTSLPVPEGEDFGYAAFIAQRDGILMGRGSYEQVRGYDPWPYSLPVTVLSRQLASAPPPAPKSVQVAIIDMPLREALTSLYATGHRSLYADGGQILSSLLREGLLASLIVTRVPLLLGEGLPLFSATGEISMQLQSCQHWENGFVQCCYHPQP